MEIAPGVVWIYTPGIGLLATPLILQSPFRHTASQRCTRQRSPEWAGVVKQFRRGELSGSFWDCFSADLPTRTSPVPFSGSFSVRFFHSYVFSTTSPLRFSLCFWLLM